MTQQTPRIPSYLEAFSKGLSDRDRIRLFVTSDILDMIPERIDTGFMGITVDRATVLNKLMEYVNNAPDELVAEIVKRGHKRFG